MQPSAAHVVNVSEATFQQDVLDHSQKAPVILDFWAPWCGPCKTLGPILEDLAETYQGAFRLAKIDVDENPQLAMAVRVQSIPMIVAVYQGAFIDQFMGAKPKAEVKQFVDGVLERAGIEVPTGEVKVPTDPVKALAFWQERLQKNAEDDVALLALGKLYFETGELDSAKQMLESITATMDSYNAAQATLQLFDLLNAVNEAGGEAAARKALAAKPDDDRARYLVACSEAGHGHFEAALTDLIALVARSSADVRGDAKKAASQVLAVAGREDPAIEKLRRRLAVLLF